MKNIKRKYNLVVDLSKFISNKKILIRVVTLGNNKFCCQILSIKYISIEDNK